MKCSFGLKHEQVHFFNFSGDMATFVKIQSDTICYQKRSFLPQKWSPLTQNQRDPQKAPVQPRIYLGLKYEHLTPSGSRDTARTKFVIKNVVFYPKNGAP